jgi:hypothetical protein
MSSPTYASGTTEVLSLLSIITNAANTAMAEYTARGLKVPSIHSLETHPIDLDESALELRKAIKTLEGACNQLCATLAPPSHTLLNASLLLPSKISRIDVQRVYLRKRSTPSVTVFYSLSRQK